MPFSSAVVRAVAVDNRIFRRSGDGFVFCAPVEEGVADAHLRNMGIRCEGPWHGCLIHRGVWLKSALAGCVAAVIWHLSVRDIARLDAAGLIDHDRAADYSV